VTTLGIFLSARFVQMESGWVTKELALRISHLITQYARRKEKEALEGELTTSITSHLALLSYRRAACSSWANRSL
jgi:hypothetical protein